MAYLKPTLQLGGVDKLKGREGYLLGWNYDSINARYQPVKYSFSRNSGGSYIDENGILRWEPRADWPRFTWQDGKKLVMNEVSRENLITNSENIDPATTPWLSFSGTNYTLNAGTAPDNTSSATKIFVNSTSQQYALYQNYSNTGQFTLSCYVKAEELDTFCLKLGGAISANFNLTTITSSNELNCTANIYDAGNEWRRCSITSNTGATTAYAWLAITSGVTSGTSTDGILVWGAQLEEGGYASSYIPTYGTPVTRATESINAQNIEQYVATNKGAFIWSGILGAEDAEILNLNRNTQGSAHLYTAESGGQQFFRVYIYNTSGSNPLYTLGPVAVPGEYYKVGVSFESGNIIVVINGVTRTVTTDTYTWTVDLSGIWIGQGGYAQGKGILSTEELLIFDDVLTEQQLIDQTTI